MNHGLQPEGVAAAAAVEVERREGGAFIVAAETTRMPMVFMDAKAVERPIIFANDSFLRLSGYDRDEVLGRDFNFMLPKGDSPAALAAINAAFGDDDQCSSEVCYRRKDGSEFWAALFISPVVDDSGNVIQHFASFIDLTQHKNAQARSAMLINELNHRVKNTLATVQSIVTQTLRNETDPEKIRESIESRLIALSRSHDLLTHENWESAGLLDVVNAALEPFRVAGDRSQRITVSGKNVRFPPKAALALGIAINELATNAVKYGALSSDSGRVRVEWAIAPAPDGDMLELSWREEGGPPVTAPTRKGFGSQVIERGLAMELEGATKLDYRSDGVACTISIPAPTPASIATPEPVPAVAPTTASATAPAPAPGPALTRADGK